MADLLALPDGEKVTRNIDLNADPGEGFGPWTLDDAKMMGLVTSASIACGGHAGDPDTMFAALVLAREHGVTVGAHPGYADREGFGRRIIPMPADGIARMVAAQIGALIGWRHWQGFACAMSSHTGRWPTLRPSTATWRTLLRVRCGLHRLILRYWPCPGRCWWGPRGLEVHAEVFADRAHLPDGRLVPRHLPGAVIHDADAAADRLLAFLRSGLMPVLDGSAIRLEAQSVCVHGDTPGALAMARKVRSALVGADIGLCAFAGAVARPGPVWHANAQASAAPAGLRPVPRPGDRVEIDGEAFLIQGEPVRDRERLVWTLDLRPA